ncbi:hypothetical protein [Colwellia psychrerythraea]|uniref:STAS/SEC14 domain-containing protein n=1 Tax=Colwellia psychrerythraea TaxID=28229 RepID=A0A099L4I0_COLPS|nr:hypothetical protein [Colwellia psychrerythraea]KGJ97355.1 hypothetical protein GAB14E_0944 [Colwellia psychrerythraea]
MVHQFHDFLLGHLVSPFSLLINKVNAYSYNFDAQVNIGNLTEIHAIAVIAYQNASHLNTEYLAKSVPRAVAWNVSIHSNRDEALNWLQLEQARLNKVSTSPTNH